MKKTLVKLFIISCALAFFNCANQSPPTGGPKDETPPKLIGMYPEDNMVDFEGKKIELLFDERVDGNAVQKELIISPNIKIPYEIKTQRNSVILEFDENLPDSTTFSIDFRSSITDVTEKNESDPIKLAFSTGPYLDTLGIAGEIKNVMTNQPLVDVLIGIYDVNDTLNIEEDEPIYFTRTDSLGIFSLSNVRVGEYSIYALQEKDNSLTYNKIDEGIGFMNSTVQVKDSIAQANLFLLRYDETDLKLIASNSRRQYAELIFSKNLTDYKIEWADSLLDEEIYHTLNENTILFYDLGENKTDSLKLTYTVRDSLYNSIEETVNIKFNKTDNPAEIIELSSQFFPENTALIEGTVYPLSIRFNKPIQRFQPDSMYLIRAEKDTIPLSGFQSNHNKTIVDLGSLEAIDSLEFIAKKGTFISVENDTVKEIRKKFTLKDPSKFSQLGVGIERNGNDYIAELLDEQYTVEQTIANQDTLIFNYLTPGQKFLRIIIDKNKNGRWDKGSFKRKEVPEPTLFLKDEIQLKENWEIGGYNILLPKLNN